MPEKKRSRAAEAMSGEKHGKPGKKDTKKGKKKVRRMHLERSANDGFIAEHDHFPGEDGMIPEMEKHTLSDRAKLHGHLDQYFGDEEEAPLPEESPDTAPIGGPDDMPPTPMKKGPR